MFNEWDLAPEGIEYAIMTALVLRPDIERLRNELFGSHEPPFETLEQVVSNHETTYQADYTRAASKFPPVEIKVTVAMKMDYDINLRNKVFPEFQRLQHNNLGFENWLDFAETRFREAMVSATTIEEDDNRTTFRFLSGELSFEGGKKYEWCMPSGGLLEKLAQFCFRASKKVGEWNWSKNAVLGHLLVGALPIRGVTRGSSMSSEASMASIELTFPHPVSEELVLRAYTQELKALDGTARRSGQSYYSAPPKPLSEYQRQLLILVHYFPEDRYTWAERLTKYLNVLLSISRRERGR